MTMHLGSIAQSAENALRELISCEALSHSYSGGGGSSQVVLSGIDLSIGDGEFVCLLGPSGCGKTTLLNLIAGFLHPTRGAVKLEGKPIHGPGPDRGVVFQGYSLFTWLRVVENVEFGLKMAGTPKSERRRLAKDMLARVHLGEHANKYPYELSGGMKQRVAIARALLPRPRVLLMDEPFAALDAMTRASLQNQILEIQERDRQTVVFVTHNIGEAIFLADRIIVLSSDQGSIADDVRVDLARPRRRTSRAFNVLHEHLERAVGLQVGE